MALCLGSHEVSLGSLFFHELLISRAFQVTLVVKNSPVNAGVIIDTGLIAGLGRSPGEGHATHSSFLAWRIPWTEDPGRLQSTGLHRVEHD